MNYPRVYLTTFQILFPLLIDMNQLLSWSNGPFDSSFPILIRRNKLSKGVLMMHLLALHSPIPLGDLLLVRGIDRYSSHTIKGDQIHPLMIHSCKSRSGKNHQMVHLTNFDSPFLQIQSGNYLTVNLIN